MNKRAFLVALSGLLLVLVAASFAGAQSSADFDLSWYVLGGGGDRADSADYVLNGTLGQGLVAISESADWQVQSGYWYGAALPGCRVYLPVVLRGYH
jgi:hypothetical protein